MPCQLHRIIGRGVCLALLLGVMPGGAASGSQQTATAASTFEQRLARVRADLYGPSPRLDENIRELNAILAIDPRSAEAHLLLGIAHSAQGKPEMVAEDFGELGKAAGVPSVLIRIGAADPKKHAAATAAGTPLPSLHSATFAPDRERTIRTDTSVLVLAALELLRAK